MVEWGKSRGQAETWPPGGSARRGRAVAWPAGLAGAARTGAEHIRLWVLAETGPGRLLPWLPVAFGLGIAIYFAAEREPNVWVAAALALVCCCAAWAVRRRPIAFPAILGAAAVAAGFAIATLKANYSRSSRTDPSGRQRRDRRFRRST
jgi:competence protein ComEC